MNCSVYLFTICRSNTLELQMARSKTQRVRRGQGGRDDARALISSMKRQYADEPPVGLLQEVVAKVANPGADLAWLAAYDADPELSQHAFTLLFVGLKDPSVPPRIHEMIKAGARPVLLEAVKKTEVPDDRKFMLGPAYVLCGDELSNEDYRKYFRDFDAVARQMFEKVGDEASDQPESVHRALIAMELLEEEDEERLDESIEPVVASCLALCLRNPEAAAATLCAATAIACEKQVESESFQLALETVADRPSPRVAWYLGELGRWPGCGELGKRAATLASTMEAGGTTARCTLFREFSHGVVSMVDGIGSRSVTLFFRTPEGGMDGLVLILNDTVGMKDAWCAFDDSADLEAAVRQGRDDVLYAPCTIGLARELVADVWALHEQQERPFPGRFFIYRLYLGEELIEPCWRTPNLGAYMLETMVTGPALVKGSEILGDNAPYGGLWFSSDDAYQFIKNNRSKQRWQLPKGKFEAYVRLIAPIERDQLLARMAVNLEAEAIAGRGTRKLNQIAARTWLGIKEQVCPLEEVPYIRALAKQSVQMIAQNLRSGYECQEQANLASLEMDDEMAELLRDFDESWDDLDNR